MIQEEGHRGDRDQRCSCLLAQRDKDDGCYDVSSRREPLGFIARRGGKRPFLKAQFCSSFFFVCLKMKRWSFFYTPYTYQWVICMFIIFMVLLHYYDYDYFTKATVIANTAFIYYYWTVSYFVFHMFATHIKLYYIVLSNNSNTCLCLPLFISFFTFVQLIFI